VRAVVLTGPEQAAVHTVPDPWPGEGEVLVAVEAVGICGTDLELWHGTMNYVREGRSTYPLIPGHEWTGTIMAVGGSAPGLRPGMRVVGETVIGCGTCRFCRARTPALCPQRQEVGILGRPGALAEFLVVPARTVHVLPVDRTEIGVFAEPLAVAATAVARLGRVGGQDVWVQGLGTLGTLAAGWAALHGARVFGADIRGGRRTALERAGGRFVADWGSLAAEEPVLALEASGSPAGLAELLRHVPAGSRVCLVGLPAPHRLDIAQVAFRHLELTGFIGSDPDLWGTVGDYLVRGLVPPTDWIALEVVSLDDIPDVLPQVAAGELTGKKVVCRIRG
jgi:threonine dehydrogenase-like Zn-dependent dehydrogenase